jgi:tetratricopeptide (TPR) repeat protein
MTGYVFYSIGDEELRAWGIDPLPLPVREEIEQDVFEGGRVRLHLLADELRLFTEKFPDLARLYASSMEVVSLLAAMEREREGDGEAAARYLESGLDANPESLPLRSGYAMSLHSQGRVEEAMEQYERVLAAPGGRENPTVCLAAARLYAERGEYLEAYRLLEEAASPLPPDDPFRGFLAEMKEYVDARREDGARGKPADTAISTACGGCGAPMLEGERFCASCGKGMVPSPAAAPSCPACGKAFKEGERFCSGCGSPVGEGEPGGAACPGCGLKLKQGSRFCRRCGRPQ